MPQIPRSLLSERLRSLQREGIVERRSRPGERTVEYHLTLAGRELSGVIKDLGEWGQRWVSSTIRPDEFDPALLMWDIRRRIHLDRLPPQRVVVQFEFTGVCSRTFWLILERPEPSVCLKPFGLDIDLWVTADTESMHRIWLGNLAFADALQAEKLRIEGKANLVQAFPTWLALSLFADVRPVARPAEAVGPMD